MRRPRRGARRWRGGRGPGGRERRRAGGQLTPPALQDRSGDAELVEAALLPRTGPPRGLPVRDPPPEATLVGGLRLPLPRVRTATAHLALCGHHEPKPGRGLPNPEQEDADPVLDGADPVLEWRPAILDLEACLERKRERWKLELLRGSLLAPLLECTISSRPKQIN